MTRSATLALFWIFLSHLCAQDIAGTWTGTPSPNGSLTRFRRLQINLSKDRNGKLSGEVYAGTARNVTFPCLAVTLTGSKLSFTIAPQGSVGALSFTGVVSEDENSIEGWLEGQRFRLERVGHARQAKTAPSEAARPPGNTADSSALLSRVLDKLSGTSLKLQKYTCLETVDRSYYSKPAGKLGPDVMTVAPSESCDGRGFSTDGLALDVQDRLRMDVAISEGKEIQSWPGASFDSRSVYDLAPDGPKSTGAFGTILVDVFENPGRQYAFLGANHQGNREIFEYAFEVPFETSHYFVKAGAQWKKTAYHGSFALDASTAELVRVATETAELPSDTLMCRARAITDYHYQQIGKGQFLIPNRSEFDTVSPNSNETHSVTSFSACHAYTAESTLVFDGQAPAAIGASAPKAAEPLPSGLSLSLALVTSVDTDTAAAGDPVSARVTKAVRSPSTKEILVAAGAIAHGRIVQMTYQVRLAQYHSSIRYNTLEQNGVISPLAIRLERDLKAEQPRAGNGFARRGAEFSLPLPSAPGEAGSWFIVPAALGRSMMQAGSESKWVTVTP